MAPKRKQRHEGQETQFRMCSTDRKNYLRLYFCYSCIFPCMQGVAEGTWLLQPGQKRLSSDLTGVCNFLSGDIRGPGTDLCSFWPGTGLEGMAKVVSQRVRLDFGKGFFPRERLRTEQVPRQWSQHQAWLSLRNICTTHSGMWWDPCGWSCARAWAQWAWWILSNSGYSVIRSESWHWPWVCKVQPRANTNLCSTHSSIPGLLQNSLLVAESKS